MTRDACSGILHTKTLAGFRENTALSHLEQLMSLRIAHFGNHHLEAAALLVADRYRELRATAPSLPDRYGNVDTLMPMLADLHGRRLRRRR